ncbi:MAG: FtsX-like permease family protein [Proteobacteria bacterium]|jgi:ABC-type lipoprotein release transport system permease subunit|nr:FtsX-like permease family protein [Desulfocapsa sp.]MBU3945318.1 FtsX-like permease family protein [Pseudomonadota bacterium]MCG2744615.1 FtsX-like permease family protein [Desulfobacteraceae bacterium]MBU3984463.1 FtsX-like permease family protein [Pseudomonadota bacterium]MBU4028658.1 FtsX-like permease family protein [Pseudomonadota bacterium]
MGAIEKQRNILDFTLSSLGRRKGKNIALVVVYTFVIFLLASVLFFTHSLKKEAFLILQDAPEMTVQRLLAGRQDLIPTHYIDTIRQIRGVQSVAPRLWGYYYDAMSGANYTLMVNAELNDRAGEIIIGNGVSMRSMSGKRNQALRRNDIIPFKTYDGSVLTLKVRGLLPFASELVTADLILVSEADFRKLFSIANDQATDLVLNVRNAKELSTIAAKITQIHPDTRPILREEILRTYDAVFDWRGGVIFMVLSGVFFAFIILAWDKATGLSAEEKREIGILKAIGWETSDILLMKFWEGSAVSMAAFFMGIFLAYLHIFLASSILFEPVLKGWSVLYPSFRLTPYISVYHIATLFFLTVIPYTVVTIVPSWRSATIDPDSVMRM